MLLLVVVFFAKWWFLVSFGCFAADVRGFQMGSFLLSRDHPSHPIISKARDT